jgi:hypothetical protein
VSCCHISFVHFARNCTAVLQVWLHAHAGQESTEPRTHPPPSCKMAREKLVCCCMCSRHAQDLSCSSPWYHRLKRQCTCVWCISARCIMVPVMQCALDASNIPPGCALLQTMHIQAYARVCQGVRWPVLHSLVHSILHLGIAPDGLDADSPLGGGRESQLCCQKPLDRSGCVLGAGYRIIRINWSSFVGASSIMQ